MRATGRSLREIQRWLNLELTRFGKGPLVDVCNLDKPYYRAAARWVVAGDKAWLKMGKVVRAFVRALNSGQITYDDYTAGTGVVVVDDDLVDFARSKPLNFKVIGKSEARRKGPGLEGDQDGSAARGKGTRDSPSPETRLKGRAC